MQNQNWDTFSHRRFNPLTGEWILVSPQRTKRPWTGQKESPDTTIPPQHDPECYLCPGNGRAGGMVNPIYTDTFVFTNDYAALGLENLSTKEQRGADPLLRAEPETGICRVICYSPRHDLTMARMEPSAIERVINSWQEEYNSLGTRETINYVQIFENRGQAMGCSNPHPHGQIWANSSIPVIAGSESRQQQDYMHAKNSCLLCNYLALELQENQRILFANGSYVALIPFWAVWPFETMILPRRHASSITSLTREETVDLASIMNRLSICYDNLFQTSFPYSMGIHQRPTDGQQYDFWHYHIHYYPPLLRSKTVKKHMVGYELMAMPQRDLTAEMAAERLREQPTVHYLEREEQ